MNINLKHKQEHSAGVKKDADLCLVKDTGKAINNNKLPVSCRYAELKMDCDFGLGGIL